MPFLLASLDHEGHGSCMKRTRRLSIYGLILTALVALWISTEPRTALGITLSLLAFLFVVALKNAAHEILKFERNQRPDLHI
jgi:hypothetical protein